VKLKVSKLADMYGYLRLHVKNSSARGRLWDQQPAPFFLFWDIFEINRDRKLKFGVQVDV